MPNAGWKQFECDIAHIFNVPTTRQQMQTSGLPQPDGDLALGGTPYWWLHTEMKRRQRLAIPQWVRETETAADGKPWLLVVKRFGVADPLESYAISTLRHVKPWIDLAAADRSDRGEG